MPGSTTLPAALAQPLAPVLAERWSPRGFDANAELDAHQLRALLTAALWAPSAGNSQPWRLLAARRGTEAFDAIAATLGGFNRAWAPRASALIVFAVDAHRDGAPLRWAEYDLGQAAMSVTVQAAHLGLHVHQMGGFSVEALRDAFALPAHLEPVTVMAVGRFDDSDDVPDDIRARDAGERTRRPLEELLLRPLE